MRYRRLHTSSTDPMRPPGDLRATNRQDSTDAPAMVASSISRIKKINFFGPQEVSHCSLLTTNEPKAPRTTACRPACLLVPYMPLARRLAGHGVVSFYAHLDRRTLAQECHSTYAIDAAAALRVTAYPQTSVLLSDQPESRLSRRAQIKKG